MPARGFAIAVGALFVLFGILGFVHPLVVYPMPAPGSPHTILMHWGYGALFGIFPVNYVRNAVQILLGALGLAAGRSYPSARIWAQLIFYYSAVMLFLGLFRATATLFGLMPIFGWNVGFHFFIAALSFYFALIYPLDRLEPEPAR
jgi:hypothetical protein